MKRINNLELLKYSLKNKEPYIDDYYVKQGDLIISEDPKHPSKIMQINRDLIKAISAYEFSMEHGGMAMAQKAIDEIFKCVQTKKINYSEFVSFWPVVDISYSVYQKMPSEQQKKLLKGIIEKYIKMRHEIYLKYGYTHTTLQVGKDAKAHKESGNLGINKVSELLDANDYKNANDESVNDFISKGNKKYIQADKKGKKLFKELLKHYGAQFEWSKKREGKMPDFLVRNNSNIFIVEHKHIKEGGGGQDKQVNEMISFIGYLEKNISIHYVAFLDGIYFNILAENTSQGNKLYTQLNLIRSILRSNINNYFVNTSGFKKLLSIYN
jgi:hypothetical protein